MKSLKPHRLYGEQVTSDGGACLVAHQHQVFRFAPGLRFGEMICRILDAEIAS